MDKCKIKYYPKLKILLTEQSINPPRSNKLRIVIKWKMSLIPEI
jgi:hypothetical protein